VVDAVLAETEAGRAMREMKLLDSGFDEHHFVIDMRDT
jgi:hypothetical protein